MTLAPSYAPGTTSPSKTPAAPLPQPPDVAASPAPPPPKAIAALLKKADKAFAAEHLLEPKDTNALALYQQVLSADKDNAAAQAGIEKIHKSLLQQAGVALDRGDEKESARLIAAIAELAHPGGDLAALQTREKTLLQVMPLLTRAAELLKQGHATEPPQGNALEVYRNALEARYLRTSLR